MNAKTRPTYDDILALPEHVTAEILDGELHVMKHPGMLHPGAVSQVVAEVGSAFAKHRRDGMGWRVLYKMELRLEVDPDFDTVVPDVTGWHFERVPEVPMTGPMKLRPDWVCEVLTPSTAAIDRALKMPFYARAGIPHAWVIDPIARTLEAFRNEGGRWLVVGAWRDDAKVRAEPFDAVEIDLAEWWA